MLPSPEPTSRRRPRTLTALLITIGAVIVPKCAACLLAYIAAGTVLSSTVPELCGGPLRGHFPIALVVLTPALLVSAIVLHRLRRRPCRTPPQPATRAAAPAS